MKQKLSFQAQIIVMVIVMGVCFVLSELLHTGVFQNIAWICVGLLWIINPIWPKMWDYADHEKLKKGAVIAGAIMIAVGLMGRFGGY